MYLKFQAQKEAVIGLGIDFQVLDQKTGLPVPRADEIVKNLHHPRVTLGLFQSVIEVDTELHISVSEAMAELRGLSRILLEKCHARGLTLLSSGTHPAVSWISLSPTSDPILRKLLDRLAWVGKRMAVFGLRIHVGVPDAEKAISIAGALRNLIPLFVALSASSPYWNGQDTGLASVRARIIENVPNAGIPPKFINWAEFVRFVKTLRAAEAIHDLTEIWWDIRPVLSRGTIRIQACDAPHTLREIGLLASIAHATVHTLIQYYREGERILEQTHILIRENKWRASRFGLEAQLIISLDGSVVPLRSFLEMTLEKILPSARSLGCATHLAEVEEILAYGPGYIRQRVMRNNLNPQQTALAISQEFETDLNAE